MKRILIIWFLVIIVGPGFSQSAQTKKQTALPDATNQKAKKFAGNPIFPGWYADPEGIIFGKEYWIYPTYSAPYNQQVFMDAFSSPDLINWTKHSRIIDTTSVKWEIGRAHV